MNVVCITGMHRSGTSMVSRMLNLCGIHLGTEKELLPPAADNPEGFWENINFVKINEKILLNLKSTWDNPPTPEAGWELSSSFDPCGQEAKTLINAMAIHSQWGWKDPRTSLTLPFWRQLIPDLKVVICLRNPLEVAQSLIHRNGFSYKFTMDLWKAYYEALLSNPAPENQIITHYNSYFIDPQTELQRLLDFIGVSADAHMIKQACETTIPALRHNRATIESLIKNGATGEVASLYAKLCTKAGPVYWNTERNTLQEYLTSNNKDANLMENHLLLGLVEKDPVIQTLVRHIADQEQSIQSLTTRLKQREHELSVLPIESKTSRDLTTAIPIEALKVFALIWRIFTTMFPRHSRRERIVSFLMHGAVKLHNRRYHNWISRVEAFSEQERSLVSAQIESLKRKPLISVLMPVYNPPVRFLDEAIKSVKAQLYQNWELCIADDASPNYLVRSLIEKYAKEDPRIRYVFRNTNGHISASSNSALELATGEFSVLLDHDDVLHSLALYHVAEQINKYPDLEVIYSDEDRLNERGERTNPYFKPDYDYDLLLSQNMVSHLGAYRTDTIRDVGGFRVGFEGSQDYDLLFRVLERSEPHQIRHIPRVLYHWRVSNQSAASGLDAKPYAYDAGLRVLKDHLARKGVDAFVEPVPNIPAYRVIYSVPPTHPAISIIVCSIGPIERLEQCINSILSSTTYQNYNILVCLNGEPDVNNQVSYQRRFEDHRVSFMQNETETNQSNLINQAVMNSGAEYICLLDENIYGFSSNWLDVLVGQVAQPETGAVGPLLLQPNGRIFSSGLILSTNKVAERLFSGFPRQPSYYGWATIQKGFSAISDLCQLVGRSHFLDIGGYNETISTRYYANIDFCLRLREKGLRNVVTPIVELYIHQDTAYNEGPWRKIGWPSSNAEKDQQYIKDHWQSWLKCDPAFNPNLDLKRGGVLWRIPSALINN